MEEEQKEKKTISIPEIRGMLDEIADNQIDNKLNQRIADITGETQKSMEATQAEMRDIVRLLREQYNKDSRNKPFKDISADAKDYVNEIWKPLIKQVKGKGTAVDSQRALEIIQKTSTVSTEGDDVQGGSTVGPS